jgi:hypothetical protein
MSELCFRRIDVPLEPKLCVCLVQMLRNFEATPLVRASRHLSEIPYVFVQLLLYVNLCANRLRNPSYAIKRV